MYERTESIESYCLGNQIALCSALPNALAISLNCISSGIFRPQVFLNSLSLLSPYLTSVSCCISLDLYHFFKHGSLRESRSTLPGKTTVCRFLAGSCWHKFTPSTTGSLRTNLLERWNCSSAKTAPRSRRSASLRAKRKSCRIKLKIKTPTPLRDSIHYRKTSKIGQQTCFGSGTKTSDLFLEFSRKYESFRGLLMTQYMVVHAPKQAFN